jgi:hypothetical protein
MCLHQRGRSYTWTCLQSIPQRPVLHLDVSTPRGLSCTWTWLDNMSLCCSWTCLHYRGVSCTLTYLDHCSLCCYWIVYATEACDAAGHVYTLGPEMSLDVSNPKGLVLINYLLALLSRLTQFALLSLFLGTKLFAKLRYIHSLISLSLLCFDFKILKANRFASLQK